LRESHRGIRDSLVKPDEGLAAIWLVRLALLIVSVLSLMAQSQVRLFLVTPTGRQTHLRSPGRKSLSDFDQAKQNYVRRFASQVAFHFFRNRSILTSGSGTGRACWFHHRPLRHLPVTESSALPPDPKVECNDRLPGRNPTARNSATPLPKMPNSHEACSHLAGT
jgi:hypothetical protein